MKNLVCVINSLRQNGLKPAITLNIINKLFIIFLLILPITSFCVTYNISTETDLNNALAAAIDGDIFEIDAGITITFTSVKTISDNIIINGHGATINHNGMTTITISSAKIVEINDLTFTGATNRSIINQGTLTVNNSTFSGNSSTAAGGAIYNFSGTLTVNNSTFSGNSSNSQGGAIYSPSVMTLTVNNSTFSGNSAFNSGGGISSASGTLTVNNSTFSGNSSPGTGGGISSSSGTLTVNNSTFSGNSASQLGGAIHINFATLNLSNSILANSILPNDDLHLANTTVNINLNNLVESCSGVGCPIFTLTADPMLGPLQDNGGPTETFALLVGSPAINAGDAGSCLPTDQRGFGRNGVCDIGAFEFEGIDPTDPIPTLSQWALFILGLTLTSMAVVTIRKSVLAVS